MIEFDWLRYGSIDLNGEPFLIICAFLLFIILSVAERVITSKFKFGAKFLSVFFVLTSYIGVLVLVFITRKYIVSPIADCIETWACQNEGQMAEILLSAKGLITFSALTALIYISIFLTNVLRSRITGRKLNYPLIRMLFYLTYTTMLVYYSVVEPDGTNDIYVVLVIEALLDIFVNTVKTSAANEKIAKKKLEIKKQAKKNIEHNVDANKPVSRKKVMEKLSKLKLTMKKKK